MSAPIEQVILRKLGGYNLKSVSWWNELSTPEQEQLVADASVQFFSGSVELDPVEVMRRLRPVAVKAAPAAVDSAVTALTWPSPGVTPTTATYVRRVVAGPSWEVTRTDENGTTHFYMYNQYPGPDIYDLDTDRGSIHLSNDLLLDALGLSRDALATHRDVFFHFKTSIFNRELGNRVWEITTQRIRSLLESHPNVSLVQASMEMLPPPTM